MLQRGFFNSHFVVIACTHFLYNQMSKHMEPVIDIKTLSINLQHFKSNCWWNGHREIMLLNIYNSAQYNFFTLSKLFFHPVCQMLIQNNSLRECLHSDGGPWSSDLVCLSWCYYGTIGTCHHCNIIGMYSYLDLMAGLQVSKHNVYFYSWWW